MLRRIRSSLRSSPSIGGDSVTLEDVQAENEKLKLQLDEMQAVNAKLKQKLLQMQHDMEEDRKRMLQEREVVELDRADLQRRKERMEAEREGWGVSQDRNDLLTATDVLQPRRKLTIEQWQPSQKQQARFGVRDRSGGGGGASAAVDTTKKESRRRGSILNLVRRGSLGPTSRAKSAPPSAGPSGPPNSARLGRRGSVMNRAAQMLGRQTPMTTVGGGSMNSLRDIGSLNLSTASASQRHSDCSAASSARWSGIGTSDRYSTGALDSP